MRYSFVLITLLFFYSCFNDNSNSQPLPSEIKNTEQETTINNFFCDTFVTEIDSTNFGIKNECKVECRLIRYKDSSLINIKLFNLQNKTWIITDTCSFKSTSNSGPSPEYIDFNNDGYNDLLVRSLEAARGANVVQTLLIFDSINKKLIRIKNSESYPNLNYNDELDCIDALSFTGSLTTSFLKLKNDSLIEYAAVEQSGNQITTYKTNKEGKWVEINRIKDSGFSDFARFKNFSPLKEYD